ncbi:MAG TPA: hypothetical protein VGL66_19710 [Caulobacteraceae bacterium]
MGSNIETPALTEDQGLAESDLIEVYKNGEPYKGSLGDLLDFLLANAEETENSFTSLQTFAELAIKHAINGGGGTFVANGLTPVDVGNTSLGANDVVVFSLKTVGGTVGVVAPTLASFTAGTGFSVVAQALDTSTYNYVILRGA